MTLGRTARAFTLVELLVVITLIAILVGLIGGVGARVVQSRKVAVTQGILGALDRALDEFNALTSSIPAYRPEDYDKVPGENNDSSDTKFFPLYRGGNHPTRPDASVFIRQVFGTGEVDAIIRGMGERFLIITPGKDDGTTDSSEPNDDFTPSVVDYWAQEPWSDDAQNKKWDITKQQLIYYVHPDNLMAQDLYGQCINRRPYFMSAGPDLKYGLGSEFNAASRTKEKVEGALSDNIYSYTVGEPLTDQQFYTEWRATK